MAARRGRWVLASATGAALVIGAVIRLRARRGLSQADARADVSFMRALHAALRRDLSRLRDAAAQLDGSAGVPPTVLAGWDAFRAQLDNHHSAEDDDLWPVLRGELSDPGDLASVDAMVEEHRHIPLALAGVDAALRGGGELTAPAGLLSAVVLDHLAHEEREVLPLIEQHLTRAQWRAFLHKERSRRPPRERPEFLTGSSTTPASRMRRPSWPRCRRRPGWSTAGCSAPATTRSIGGRSPVPLRNFELAARDPAGHRECPAAGMTSQLRQRAGKWPARPRTQLVMRPARTVRSSPGSGRWLVFG